METKVSDFLSRAKENLDRINRMNDAIKKAGGLFYQYRPCRIDKNTIYDIENISHGVVYARSPLYMNDPFDSELGFSSEKLMDELVEVCIENIDASVSAKKLMGFILKNKLLNSFTDLIKGLNLLKKELNISLPTDLNKEQLNRVRHRLEASIKKLPKDLQKIFNKKNIENVFALIIGINSLEINEEEIDKIVNAQGALDKIVEQINEIRENVYAKTYRKFLSTINISCFSASGWNNALMWAHYANSYGGICIEYDISNIKDFIGFIYPVDYLHPRPLLSIKDLGITKDNLKGSTEVTDEIIWRVINYLLVKDKVWNYEEEWRIIDVQQSGKPSFIKLPYIKSITMGPKVEPLVKHWVINLCREKNIECYNLKLSYDSFGIDRERIDLENFEFNFDDEGSFVVHLSEKFSKTGDELGKLQKAIKEKVEEGEFDYDAFVELLTQVEDGIMFGYYLKNSINNMRKYDEGLLEPIGEQVVKALQSIDNFVDDKETLSDMQVSIVGILHKGLINYKQFKLISSKLDSICSLIEYYQEKTVE